MLSFTRSRSVFLLRVKLKSRMQIRTSLSSKSKRSRERDLEREREREIEREGHTFIATIETLYGARAKLNIPIYRVGKQSYTYKYTERERDCKTEWELTTREREEKAEENPDTLQLFNVIASKLRQRKRRAKRKIYLHQLVGAQVQTNPIPPVTAIYIEHRVVPCSSNNKEIRKKETTSNTTWSPATQPPATPPPRLAQPVFSTTSY